jgi:large subunit ribosomal protein L30
LQLKRLKFLLSFWQRHKLSIMKKIKITLVKSPIDRPERQKLTLQALGLNKMNATREVEATPQILGMVRKVEHMLTVEEVA